ncbi:alcohol dehydrogenase [Synergistales bacterium]|nr:alcohol dehydrogenase [Synergistales bacterium]
MNMDLDKDLRSIQEVRHLVAKAKEAGRQFARYDQTQVDKLVAAIARACADQAEPLAKMAAQETGFGIWQDKVLKNLLGSSMTWEYIKDMKTVGVLREDKALGITEVGVGLGVVAALIPSTNPTSTTMYKALISLKAGNAIVFSPHPGAKNCIEATAKLIAEAARKAGAPDGLVGCVTTLTMEATDALLKHKDIGMILATGGEAMVRAAYSSGNPALGVGPGNGPAYIEKSADIKVAARHIIESKTFDNGTICASEQSVVTERCIEQKVIDEFKQRGAYILNERESAQVAGILLRAGGSMNPEIVGKSAVTIAQMAGISVPQDTSVLMSPQTEVSDRNPYSREKLCPVLGFYVEENWRDACARSIEILSNEGVGHTMTIHSEDESVIREFALQKPVSRLLVNTAAALGGVGVTTNLAPALTLGCGAIGGSATSDNVTPLHLINIRRVARGVRELSSLRSSDLRSSDLAPRADIKIPDDVSFTREDIEAITKAVLNRLGYNKYNQI